MAVIPIEERPARQINWLAAYTELRLEEAHGRLLSGPSVPPVDDFWCLPVVSGLSGSVLVNAFRKRRVAVEGWDKEFEGLNNDRSTELPYFVRYKRTMEWDLDCFRLSAAGMREKGLKGITLTEAMFLLFGYCVTTNNQEKINQDVFMLCSGSWLENGLVLAVGWNSESQGRGVHTSGICICRQMPSDKGLKLCSRVVQEK